jgi:flagellar basal body rod protein FlgG
MFPGIFTALSGMNVSQNRLGSTANNLANMLTPGYRAERVDSATGPSGTGVRVVRIGRDDGAGYINPFAGPLDLAISGSGFFQVQDGQGNRFLTRDGSFALDAEGNFVNADGLQLTPPIQVPPGSKAVTIEADGNVTSVFSDGTSLNLGQIELVDVNNPDGLVARGGSLFATPTDSGAAVAAAPGSSGLGTLTSRALEGSNVDVAGEMVNLTLAKHEFAANAAVIRTQDDLLGQLVDLVG